MADPREVAPSIDRRIRAIIDVLEKDYSNWLLHVDELAKTVNLSTSRLRHLFREQTGVSIRRYAKSIQLRRARQLLQESFLSVKEISAAVHYSDLNHFVRDYKKEFNERPSETRSQRSPK